ncbi:uncharacterized protein METZ01_LOCUS428558, partial [marine metagenome]
MKHFTILLALFASSTLFGIEINQTEFNQGDGFGLETREDGLRFDWETPEGKAFIDLQIISIRGKANGPLIKEIGVEGKTILNKVDPNFLFWVGDRDLEKRPDGWMIFFDRVPTR